MSRKNDVLLEEANTNGLINSTDTRIKEREKRKAEELLQKRKEEIDERLIQLENKMYSFAEMYGLEDSKTQLLAQCYNVAVQMKECVILIDGVTTAAQYIFTTLDFFDESLSLFDNLIKGQYQKRRGIFYQIKSFFQRRAAIRNIKYKMSSVVSRITQIQGISNVIIDTMNKASIKMNKSFSKNNEKAKKKNPNYDSQVGDGIANEMIRKHLASKNISTDDVIDTKPDPTDSSTDNFKDIL